MEKWMIVYLLPLEVWMDIFVFPWIAREQFGQIVDKIGNFKFAEHAQFYLHEWGKRKLVRLSFDKEGLRKYVNSIMSDSLFLDVPQTALPENIKSFDSIAINYFDANTLDFLDKVRPLLTEVGIQMASSYPEYLDNFRTVLTNLTPLLDRTHSVYIYSCDFALPVAIQCLGADKFAKLKMLCFDFPTRPGIVMQQENVNTVVDWLAQPADGPRLCECGIDVLSENGFSAQILTAVRQQFLAAKTPSTFSLILDQRTEFRLENGIGEVLHGLHIEENGNDGLRSAGPVLQVTRHPTGCNTQEVQEWISGMCRKRHGKIQIITPTIGSLNAAQVDVQPMDEGQDVQQQKPCSSKDV